MSHDIFNRVGLLRVSTGAKGWAACVFPLLAKIK